MPVKKERGFPYQILRKSASGKPIAVATNVQGRRKAVAKAKAYHDAHPSQHVGVYLLHPVRRYKPSK